MRMTKEQADTYNQQKLLVEKELLIGSIYSFDSRMNADNEEDHKQKILESKQRLMNVYIHLGEMRNALELSYSMDGYRIDELSAIMDAIDRDDNQVCDCKDNVISTRKGYVPIPRFAKFIRMYSEKYNQWIDIYRCTICGFTQASDVFQPMKHIDQARAEGIKKHDDEVLNV